MKTLLSGQIQTKRDMIAQILDGCWKSCIEPDGRTGRPFVADAIIANPPSFAHVHCAQALGIPVHLMFTMPWSSTRFFRHPLANIKEPKEINEATRQTLNWVSFAFVEWMTWQGFVEAPVNFSILPLLTSMCLVSETSSMTGDGPLISNQYHSRKARYLPRNYVFRPHTAGHQHWYPNPWTGQTS